MSYMAGSDGSLVFAGVPAGRPRVICDGCGKVKIAIKDYGAPYSWLLDRKKVPGWYKFIKHEFTREDYCSEACYKARKTERSEVPKAKPEGPNPPVTPTLPEGDRP